jgi:hypothetical protein
MSTQESQRTTISNVDYDLVSVIYYALESAVSTSIYVTDAQWAGDQELARFFSNNLLKDRRIADQAEYLLSQRLSQGQQSQQSQTDQGQQGQTSQGQQGQGGQGWPGQGWPGQGGQGWPGQGGQGWPGQDMYGQGGFGQGMYGGGYGFGPGMYGGYGFAPGMYSGGMGWNPGGFGQGGNFGGYGGGMGSGYGQGMYGQGQQGGFGGGQFGGGQFGGSGVPSLRQITGTSDITYDLISTIFHALQSAQNSDTYIQDAQQAGDQNIVQFFQQLKQESNQRAEEARQLLAPRLSYKKWRQSQFQGGSFYGGQSGQTVGTGTGSSSSTSTQS